ncbi:alpha-D-ribose 1-methylphosphonate 5-triphosphate diphosphatase [Pelagovum pacificum]|uniref:Alpha-D-ribose 1-methylphosphonate 5-triphosphate diphosphatase n=1 Tax=Pelagovum pacificum TaxID=2588711 RepID=A0A5C5GIJ9_9RHOB|nr:alpha-D-ribose 1-methylphosphonate 5-triphosphate diphosphatase [Pelagovum pacificum]QQA43609.1 alpha-D-ribose 1-methylphosphonate 5-triphosphate diphosphatase [Pelagovum pacificum]TNY33256.1 alpha-D-ribose 1-methylphosphonate 5-triphosphate diphosphatase [Pelagovum pacificum]
MWLSDFRVVLPDRVLDRGSVRVEDGRISAIAEGLVTGAAMEGGGLLLMPGFIDMHGDMIEREVEPRPGVRMPVELGLRDLDRRLKASGITTAYASVGFHPGSVYGTLRHRDTARELLRSLKSMAGELKVDHKVHARMEITFPEALDIVEELIADGTVDLVSLMDHTPGQGQYRDVERFVRFIANERGIDEEEARGEVDHRLAESRRQAGAVERVLRAISEACAAQGIPLASHDDDTDEKVALMKRLGASISEFPVTADAAAAAQAAGLAVAMGAPNALRGTSYSGNLSAREAHRAGLLDLLAADYHPSAILPAVLVLAEQDPRGLAGSTRLATSNPARVLGLTDRGEIAEGLSADLVVADDLGVGHVRATFRAGRQIYSDGSVPLRLPVSASPD